MLMVMVLVTVVLMLVTMVMLVVMVFMLVAMFMLALTIAYCLLPVACCLQVFDAGSVVYYACCLFAMIVMYIFHNINILYNTIK